jgi:oxygen-independent coproporphyrinogen III oxidase
MSGIYIHVPFCKNICYYCDFHFSLALANIDNVLNAMLLELKLRASYLPDNKIGTIYFGGGTPSLLSSKQLMFFFDAIYQHFSVADNAEISLEANPDDLSYGYLKSLSATPINRLSVGIQSFNNLSLKLMNRRHDAETAKASLADCFDAGFSNISADIIYGMPGSGAETLCSDLDIISSFPVKHISAYSLTIEKRTAYNKFVKEGRIILPTEDNIIGQQAFLEDYLSNTGFNRYEVSNYALPGYHSKHNSNYWNSLPYLGIGPSAHSFCGSSRRWNISHNLKYMQYINSGQQYWEQEDLSLSDIYNEYIFTRLRTVWGADSNFISSRFGQVYEQYFTVSAQKYIASGHLEKQESVYKLTDKGFYIADGIASELFYVS